MGHFYALGFHRVLLGEVVVGDRVVVQVGDFLHLRFGIYIGFLVFIYIFCVCVIDRVYL